MGFKSAFKGLMWNLQVTSKHPYVYFDVEKCVFEA